MTCLRMFLVLGAMAFAVGCGKSPEQICNDAITNGCAKTIQCNPSLGLTQAQCESTAKAQTDCTKADTSCPTGYKYNSSNAQQCANDYANISCSDIAAGNVPASCANVCTAS